MTPNPNRKTLADKATRLPLQPGVYLMRDKNGDILYVGKAKALKNRVSQYFHRSAAHTPKVRAMVSHVADFDSIVTNSELEALLLECNLIKLHRPKYNILLKDDKAYPYLRVSVQEQYPRLSLAYRPNDDGARYFGPYRSSAVIRSTIRTVQQIFGIPTCKLRFPQDIGKNRPCLNYQIHRCMGLCKGEISPQQYHELFEQVLSFLNGDIDGVITQLTRQMEQASEALAFEKAAALRDRIRSLGGLAERQRVAVGAETECDVIAAAQNVQTVCFAVLMVRSGRLIDKEYRLFAVERVGSADEAMSEFLSAYYTKMIPKKILLDREVEDQPLLTQLLCDRAARKVELLTPKRGQGRELCEMAAKNAAEELSVRESRAQRKQKDLSELQRALGLAVFPARMEAYDISNTGSSGMVGGMVVFEQGLPKRSAYRRFSIESVQAPDDYAATKEMIYRRLERAWAEDEGFLPLPDLILLDGGVGHLHAVQEMFGALGVSIPLFGMVKDQKHRTRDLVGQEGEVGLKRTSPAFTLCGTIQEEVHRYAITYHRKVRQKKALRSALPDLNGLGDGRKQALLRHFGSIGKVKEATLEQLAAVPRLPSSVAQALYAYYHDAEEET